MNKIIVRLSPKTLAKKLNASFQNIIDLELNTALKHLLIADNHGLERLIIEKINSPPACIIRHKIDRREFVKKLKAITTYECYMTFDTDTGVIKLESLDKKETSLYLCSSEPARNKAEAAGLIKWGLDVFKNILRSI